MSAEDQNKPEEKQGWLKSLEKIIALISSIGAGLFALSWYLGRRYVEGLAFSWNIPLNQISPSEWDYAEVGAFHLLLGLFITQGVFSWIFNSIIILSVIYYFHPIFRTWFKSTILLVTGCICFWHSFNTPVQFLSIIDKQYVIAFGILSVLLGLFFPIRLLVSQSIKNPQQSKFRQIIPFIIRFLKLFFRKPLPTEFPGSVEYLFKKLQRPIDYFVKTSLITLILFTELSFLSKQSYNYGRTQGQRDITYNAKKAVFVSSERVLGLQPTVNSTVISDTIHAEFTYDNLYWMANNSGIYILFQDIQQFPSCKPTKVYIIKQEFVRGIELTESPIDKGCAPKPTSSPSTNSTTTPTISATTTLTPSTTLTPTP